jgi:hypothetical protein
MKDEGMQEGEIILLRFSICSEERNIFRGLLK